MAPIRNYCVARGLSASGTTSTVYTVPDNNAFIMKSILVHNPFAALVNAAVFVQSADTTIAAIALSAAVPANGDASLQTWVVINAGDHLVISSTPGQFYYWISGAVLPFVPGL